jgi:hypothetical protein
MRRRVWRPPILALAIALLPLAAATATQPAAATQPAGGHPIAYAVDQTCAGGAIDVIDTVTHASLTQVTFSEPDDAVAVTPDAKEALVVLGYGGACLGARAPSVGAVRAPGLPPETGPEVVAIDTATNTLDNTAAVVDGSPASIAVAPSGLDAYVIGGYPTATVTPVSIGAGPTLTGGTPVPVVANESPIADAVTPDGKDLLALAQSFNIGGTLVELSLPSLTPVATLTLAENPIGVVVAPGGGTAYVSEGVPGSGPTGEIVPVSLGASLTAGAPIAMPTPQGGPTHLTLATTAAGVSTLYASDGTLRLDDYVLPSGPSGALSTQQATPEFPDAIPDGTALALTTSGNQTYTITGADHPPGALAACTATTCPPGNGQIAITPDQAPVASFVATTGTAGQPTSFDASGSTIAYGTITRYAWSFGDGSPVQTTTSPAPTHTYAHTGSYTVSLTETDGAGTSVSMSPPSTVFTGQTMTRVGGPKASFTQVIAIGTTPLPTPTPTVPTPSPSATPSPIPGFHPQMTLSPRVGPPGAVAIVAGTGFPPNTPLTLAWKPGIGSMSVTTDATGAFSDHPQLIFPRDQLGLRALVATPSGVTATFLVVPPPMSPGDSDVPLELVNRG